MPDVNGECISTAWRLKWAVYECRTCASSKKVYIPFIRDFHEYAAEKFMQDRLHSEIYFGFRGLWTCWPLTSFCGIC